MNPGFDKAAVAAHFGIDAADLGLALIPHQLDGADYESVLLYDKRRAAAAGAQPGVLAVPNWFGIRQQALEVVATTVGAGFAVLVADVYGKSVRPTTPEEAGAVITALKTDRAELRRRMNAALAAFRAQTLVRLGEIGACGFCFGGTAALELARSGAALKAFASLHGALDTPNPADAKNIQGAVLVLHGVQDPSVPREQVNGFIDEMSAAGVDWQLLNYGQAGHSFTDPQADSPGFFYHRRTAQRAGLALRNFFAETLV
ncbi:MAG: dienelactone hydrolase family protein [Burkholderiaceae bacterium]